MANSPDSISGSAGKTLVRVFVSSPSDVRPERLIVQRIVQRLDREFSHYFNVETVLWEREPLTADSHFQQQIVRPSETEIVVVILWTRLGINLPPDEFRGALTGEETTGTAWEFEDALASWRQRTAPEILAYRKCTDVQISLSDEAAWRERRAQQQAVSRFFEKWFASPDAQYLRAAYFQFDDAGDFEDTVSEHLRGLLKRRLSAARATSGTTAAVRWHSGSPYRSLSSFELEHSPIFFGRTRARNEIRQILERQAARKSAFVVVMGASGSGKSSVVKAGVLADLLLPGMVENVALFRYAILRPSDGAGDLPRVLAAALVGGTALPEMTDAGYSQERLASLLHSVPAEAVAAIEHALTTLKHTARLAENSEARLLVVVDQLEEIFTLPEIRQPDRERFVNALSAFAHSQKIWVIATLRSDFFDQIETVPELVNLSAGEARYLLAPPNAGELRQVILQPAHLAGARFEYAAERGSALDELLYEDASRDLRSLPLLQFVLDQLWSAQNPAGELTFDAYTRLGGLAGAIGQHAEKIFSTLPDNVREALGPVLRALVTVGTGSGSAITGRARPLADFPEGSPQRLLVDEFLAPHARLLVADSGELGLAQVRLAHEALLTHWPKARQLIESSRADLQLQAAIEDEARAWQSAASATRRSYLLRVDGQPLEEARSLLGRYGVEVSPPATDYIQACSSERLLREKAQLDVRQAEVERHPLRTWSFYLGCLIVFLAALFPFAHESSARYAVFDAWQVYWPRERISGPVAMVAIDEASIHALGQWPWPRTVLASLIERLGAAGAAAIGIDLIMPERDQSSPEAFAKRIPSGHRDIVDALLGLPQHDATLRDTISKYPVVLGAAGLGSTPSASVSLRAREIDVRGGDIVPYLQHYPFALASLPELQGAASGQGLLSAHTSFGIARRLPLVVSIGGTLFPAFAVELLRVGTGARSISIEADKHGVLAVNVADARIPTQSTGEVWLHHTRFMRERYLSALDILQDRVELTALKHKIVIICFTGVGLVDYKVTARGEYVPGSEFHAQLIESIFDGRNLLRPRWMPRIESAFTVVVGLAFLLCTRRTSPMVTAAITGAGVFLVMISSFVLFAWPGLLFDPIPVLLVMCSAFLVQVIARLHLAIKRYQVVKSAMATYGSSAEHGEGQKP